MMMSELLINSSPGILGIDIISSKRPKLSFVTFNKPLDSSQSREQFLLPAIFPASLLKIHESEAARNFSQTPSRPNPIFVVLNPIFPPMSQSQSLLCIVVVASLLSTAQPAPPLQLERTSAAKEELKRRCTSLNLYDERPTF